MLRKTSFQSQKRFDNDLKAYYSFIMNKFSFMSWDTYIRYLSKETMQRIIAFVGGY